MGNILRYKNIPYDDSYIYGGVEYNKVLNADTNLQVGDVVSASIKFKVKENIFSVDDRFSIFYSVNDTFIGQFYVTEVVKGKTDYTITAYDAISKLDADSTEWKNSLTPLLPMTMGDILRSMRQKLSIPVYSYQFTNYNLTLDQNYFDDGLSYRQILSYMAAAAGGYAHMYSDGTPNNPHTYLQIRSLGGSSVKSFTSSNYKTLEQADYICPAIDTVWVGIQDGDIGTYSPVSSEGMGDNVLKIYNNPFLYINDTNQSAIQTAVDNIYNAVSGISYKPFKITSFTDEFVPLNGEPITINGDLSYPFSVTWNKSGVTYESTGDPSRDKVPMFSAAEQRLSGKFNVFERDLDETNSKIGNVEGQISTVSQTVDGVQITLQGNIDTLEDKVDNHAEKQLEYIRYGFGEGLVLGKEGDPISAQLTNSELAFKNGNVKNAYISSDELYISKAKVVGPQRNNIGAQLFVGELQIIRRSDGSIDFKVGN